MVAFNDEKALPIYVAGFKWCLNWIKQRNKCEYLDPNKIFRKFRNGKEIPVTDEYIIVQTEIEVYRKIKVKTKKPPKPKRKISKKEEAIRKGLKHYNNQKEVDVFINWVIGNDKEMIKDKYINKLSSKELEKKYHYTIQHIRRIVYQQIEFYVNYELKRNI